MTSAPPGEARSRVVRILAITAGLMMTGAIVGALTGALTLMLVSMAQGARSAHAITFGTGFAAMFGAAVGAAIAPLEAWLLLRRVPLWRAIVGTAGGTIAGATALAFTPAGPILGGIGGFTAVALALRATSGRKAQQAKPPPSVD